MIGSALRIASGGRLHFDPLGQMARAGKALRDALIRERLQVRELDIRTMHAGA